jgi:DNA polymerase/3'-5' exonuclease PolX
MKLDHARRLASNIIGQLRPYCDKIEVGGSIRRCKEEVKDIEIVCIPKMLPKLSDIFNPTHDEFERHPGFSKTVSQWTKVKGDVKTGKYMQRIMDLRDYPSIVEKEIKIDIFTSDESSWGSTFLIRTGPADFCKKVMVRLDELGYNHVDGRLHAEGIPNIPVPTEERFFEILKWEFIVPHQRV